MFAGLHGREGNFQVRSRWRENADHINTGKFQQLAVIHESGFHSMCRRVNETPAVDFRNSQQSRLRQAEHGGHM
jgi:ArsR family metal-binding transcriptional regulator